MTQNINSLQFFNPVYHKNEDLDGILSGELSAVKAYDQLELRMFRNVHQKQIQAIKKDHQEAVLFWRNQADISGAYPEESSSMWGLTVETFLWLSKLMGESTTLKLLKMGEEYGLDNYKKMLESDSLCRVQKIKIEQVFIPAQVNHIEILEEILNK